MQDVPRVVEASVPLLQKKKKKKTTPQGAVTSKKTNSCRRPRGLASYIVRDLMQAAHVVLLQHGVVSCDPHHDRS
jgi:hypothetical protein